MRLNQIPLRERKYAHTKQALLNAMLVQLKSKSLDEISIKEICEAVPVSEATFFNYFSRKSDLLVYFIQLWTIEVSAFAEKVANNSGLEAIESIFTYTAKRMQMYPSIIGEIMTFQTRMSEPPEVEEITLAERLLAFPELEDSETIPAKGLDSILPHYLERARHLGELPKSLDVQNATVGLASLFFGIPIFMQRISPEKIEPMYRSLLKVFWCGLQHVDDRGKSQ